MRSTTHKRLEQCQSCANSTDDSGASPYAVAADTLIPCVLYTLLIMFLFDLFMP